MIHLSGMDASFLHVETLEMPIRACTRGRSLGMASR